MKDSVIADIRVLPFGTETASVSHYVAACVNILNQAPDISYQVTPMATMLQGPLERILELLQEMHELPFTMGVNRVITNISIDDRRDKQITMESKVKAVDEKLPTSPEANLVGIAR
ncbi:hypothetical protein ES703_11709 [subsurface metagenome]